MKYYKIELFTPERTGENDCDLNYSPEATNMLSNNLCETLKLVALMFSK